MLLEPTELIDMITGVASKNQAADAAVPHARSNNNKRPLYVANDVPARRSYHIHGCSYESRRLASYPSHGELSDDKEPPG